MTDAIRVLYVDDEPDLLEIAKLSLEISNEFIIDTATSAQEVLTDRDLSIYDAIISDYRMPEMDGITFLKEVRARFGTVPFILFTGRGREEVVIEAINNGADIYLQKGGDPRSLFAELKHKIRIVVQRRQTREALGINEERLRMAQAIGKTGNWEYDLKKKTFWASEEGLRIFGIHRTTGDTTIEEIENCILDRDRNRVHRSLLDLVAHETRYDLEYEIFPADGKPRRTIHSVAKLIRSPEGSPLKVAGAIHDITERKEAERIRLESENLYRTIFENTGAATFIIRSDMVIECVNRGFEVLSGYSKEEIEGRMLWSEFVPTEDHEWMKNYHFQRRFDPQTPNLYHFRFLDRNGCIRECINNLRMIAGTSKSVASIVDITNLKRTEEELRENRRTLVTLMNNLQGMVYRCANDPDWTMEFVSEGCTALTGYDPDDLMENRTVSFGELIVPEDRQRIWDLIQSGIDRGRPFLFEYRIRDRAGTIKWVWEQGRGIFDDGGEMIALEGYIMDITRRREAEDELNRLNRRNRAMMLANPDMMFVYSADGRYLDFHAGDTSALYMPPDQFLGRSIREVLPPDIAQTLYEHLSRVVESGIPQRFEYSLEIRGETRYFESRLVPSGDQEYLSIVRDITEERQARAALVHNEMILSKKTEALAILNTVIGAATSARAATCRQALGDVLNETLHLLDFDAGGIYLVDRAAGLARVVHSCNLPAGFLKQVEEVPLDRIPYSTIFVEGMALITDHYEEIAPDRAILHGFQSMVSVPILSQARVVGALNMISTRRQVISPEERSILISIGRELGVMIERLKGEEKTDRPAGEPRGARPMN